MADHIAIKRLTASDCTLFEAVFRSIDAGSKQKSINLNADILIDRLYPGLAAPGAASENEIGLPMTIYGPTGKPAHTITRKIIKNSTYKNWRLNGEFIRGPTGDVSRYDNIRPGDLAVMAFTGDALPTRMDMVLVSQTDPTDAALYSSLAVLFGNKSMIAVTQAQIAAAMTAAAVSENHPVLVAAADPELEAALEDAAQGDLESAGKILKNKPSGGYPAFLADLRDDNGATVPFFGHPALATVFPALLARKTGLPLWTRRAPLIGSRMSAL